MIDCQTCRGHLPALEKGTLDGDMAVQVRLHLDDCEFCRAWRQRTQAERLPGAGGNGQPHNARLDAITLWYDRFEKQRQPRITARRLRLIQWAVILLAFLLVVLGIRMRGERMSRVIGTDGPPARETSRPADPAAALTRELGLSPEEGARFFPLLFAYQGRIDSLETQRASALATLDGLSGPGNEHNALVPELNARLEALQQHRVVLRSRFLTDIGQSLGPTRESRLRTLQDLWDRGAPPASASRPSE